ncbi:MAG: bifunctional folylpolyglutamate synthase/dihydrofolate synthase [Cyanobium sp.]
MSRPLTPPLPEPVDLDDLLEPFSRRGVDLGLERLQAALAEGGNPQERFAAVQVAGTNGKGSICTFLHGILRSAGLRVGTYRSPHLVSWCERIQIDDSWIRPEDLRGDLARWQEIGRRHALTPFELLTAAAFDRFARSSLDLVILEVGLGGRLDATTVHPARPVIGLASLGLDHREHLGDTLAAIAAEKAGVMAPGSTVFSVAQDPEAAVVLEAEALRRGSRVQWLDPLPEAPCGGPRLGLRGAWQRSNAAVAVAMARALSARCWSIPEQAIRIGLAEARWPGRLERRRWGGRDLLLDGAHNPPAAHALARELGCLDGDGARGGGRRWLLGIQRHKQGPEMLQALLASADRARIVAIPDHRCWDVASLSAACPELDGRLESGHAGADGLQRDLEWLVSDAEGRLPAVAGSLHLLGHLMPLLDPPS